MGWYHNGLIRADQQIYGNKPFQLHSRFARGDQPTAIERLVEGLHDGEAGMTLLGVTGSGKTFTIANVIEDAAADLIMAPNKTLAAQLYGEFRDFSRQRGRVFRVSTTTITSPRPMCRRRHLHREGCLDQRAHRTDAAVGDQGAAGAARCHRRGDRVVDLRPWRSAPLPEHDAAHLARRAHRPAGHSAPRLAELQYKRNDMELQRGAYRVRGDHRHLPGESDDEAVRVELFDDEIEGISLFDPADRRDPAPGARYTVYPEDPLRDAARDDPGAVDAIKIELEERLDQLRQANKLVEHQRLQQRTQFDLR